MGLFWEALFKYGLAIPVTVFIIGWLVRSLISKYLDKDVELFKSNLENEYLAKSNELQLKFEQFKAELELQNHKERQQFDFVHQKRIEILSEVHVGFVEMKSDLDEINDLSLSKTNDEKIKERTQFALERNKELEVLIKKNSLYLPSKISDRIVISIYDFNSIFITMNMLTYEDIVEKLNESEMVKVVNTLQENIPRVLLELESEFKLLIGNKDDSNEKMEKNE